MERIENYRRNNTYLYADAQKYLYTVNKIYRTYKYLSCKIATCHGKAKERNGRYTVTVDHNHRPDEVEYSVYKFREACKRRSAQENTSLLEIFREEQLRRPEAAQAAGDFQTVRSSMYASRRRGTPPIPTSLLEYQRFITDER